MGAKCGRAKEPGARGGKLKPVTLHIYDVGTSGSISTLNWMLSPLGTGAFHCGVEVFGKEWSFRGRTVPGSGVFVIRPKTASASYRESVVMGSTLMTEEEIEQLIQVLMRQWIGVGYDILKRNCCTFCNELCKCLGVGNIPEWVTHLANTGSALEDDLISLKGAVSGLLKAEELPNVGGGGGGSFPQRSPAHSATAAGWKRVWSGPGDVATARGAYNRLETADFESGWGSPRGVAWSGGWPGGACGPQGGLGLVVLLLVAASLGAAGAFAVSSAQRGGGIGSDGGGGGGMETRLRTQAAPITPSAPLLPLPAAAAPQDGVGFDCEVGVEDWRASWSSEKSDWCCDNKDQGCCFDCLNGYAMSDTDWSEEKSRWCCEHTRLGCSNLMPDAATTAAAASGGASGYVVAKPSSPRLSQVYGVGSAASQGPPREHYHALGEVADASFQDGGESRIVAEFGGDARTESPDG
mmetsp:Transcript_52307/g.132889  ORF Transcript_52307/g.132889 Transcript_52307/m.132889 type:complete len:466 (-) Transcript_52307:133-1530(-)